MQIPELQAHRGRGSFRTSPRGRSGTPALRRPPVRGRRFACATEGRGGTTQRKPRPSFSLAWEGRPRSARGRAAGPSRRHRTLPPLLNFKPRAQEHPGGGGFLGTGGFRTLGAVTPPLPAFPTFPERQLPRPVPEPTRDSGDRCVGGAWAGRGPAAAGGRTRAGPLLSISMNLSTWTFHVTGLIQYVACCVRDFCHLAS